MASNLSAQIEMLRRQRRQQLDQILSGGGQQMAQQPAQMQQDQQRRGPGPGGPSNVRSLYDTGSELYNKFFSGGGAPPVTQLPATATGMGPGANVAAAPGGAGLIKGLLKPGGGGGMAPAAQPAAQSSTMGTLGNTVAQLMPYLQILMAGSGHAKATRASIV